MAYISNRLAGTVLYVSSLMPSKMILCKQMKSLASMSRIEELHTVEKHLGEEGSPGLLEHHGLPLLQIEHDDHHLQHPADHWELFGGAAQLHQELLQYCLWFFVYKLSKVINSLCGECTPGIWSFLFFDHLDQLEQTNSAQDSFKAASVGNQETG